VAKKKSVVENEVQTEFPLAVDPVVQKESPAVVVEVALDAKRSVVYTDEVAAIKDSRKRDLPLFIATDNKESILWDLLHDAAGNLDTSTELYQKVTRALDAGCKSFWIVAISEHQAKLAIIDRAYPMEKVAKKDRDSRYLDLLEIAAETPKD
jgi:hypothetical protein